MIIDKPNTMLTAETQIRVRYSETDQMGVVYYGHYAQYYEVARTDMLRQVGLTYKAFEESGILLPVTRLEIDYLKPARYDDLLTIRITLPAMPSIRIAFDYEITNDAKQLLNKGHTTLVFIDSETMRPRQAPNELLDVLKPYFS